MQIRYFLDDEDILKIENLYLRGNSAQEVKDLLNLPQSVRTIQRHLKSLGILRDKGDAFRLAVKKGRITYQKKPKEELIRRKRLDSKIRFIVLEKYNNRCTHCGATTLQDRLQIDHIDENPSNNDINNLQVLCDTCNKGKAASNGKFFNPVVRKKL